ncbi:histidinol dehydrogenase [Sphingomonas sp.]|uniref:histidinol dehydrogenase n=1 Tax=Sphingomonas sp. TaxID=28214 RepID=UPI0025D95705|nr:histidinol dehydrogenase [Sphingomonas sp.]
MRIVENRPGALDRRTRREDPAFRDAVAGIVGRVRDGGWDALVAEAERIDGAAPKLVEVAPFAARARAEWPADTLAAVELAHANVTRFHEGTRPRDVAVETMPGLTVAKQWRAIDRVGLYVPGGNAPLFSTLLMLAIPARAAGVGEIVVVTPPRPDGGLDPAIALAAELCGIEAIWTVGGAQAVAAMAFGAGEIAPVAKIAGPGNAWVASAKALVSAMAGGPAIDLPAGPSELMVIADASADAATVAADLLSQAEHDHDAEVVLVATQVGLAERVVAEVERQLGDIPAARAAMAAAKAVVVESLDEAVTLANDWAPEHLSLAVADPDALVLAIRNAGAIFVGHGVAESFGDYLAGSSHVLPTGGAARAYGGVTVQSFMKEVSVLRATPEASRAVAGPAATLARLEGLEAHARAAEMRA